MLCLPLLQPVRIWLHRSQQSGLVTAAFVNEADVAVKCTEPARTESSSLPVCYVYCFICSSHSWQPALAQNWLISKGASVAGRAWAFQPRWALSSRYQPHRPSLLFSSSSEQGSQGSLPRFSCGCSTCGCCFPCEEGSSENALVADQRKTIYSVNILAYSVTLKKMFSKRFIESMCIRHLLSNKCAPVTGIGMDMELWGPKRQHSHQRRGVHCSPQKGRAPRRLRLRCVWWEVDPSRRDEQRRALWGEERFDKHQEKTHMCHKLEDEKCEGPGAVQSLLGEW